VKQQTFLTQDFCCKAKHNSVGKRFTWRVDRSMQILFRTKTSTHLGTFTSTSWIVQKSLFFVPVSFRQRYERANKGFVLRFTTWIAGK